MFLSILLHFVISVLIIVLLHLLWDFLKDNFTKKKTKDLVSYQRDKYKHIIDEIDAKDSTQPFLSIEEKEQMNHDLNDYINTLVDKQI